jgi:hypothetical protein
LVGFVTELSKSSTLTMSSEPAVCKLLFPVDLLLGVASFSLSTTLVLVESVCSIFGKAVISSSARLTIALLNPASSSSLATYMTFKKYQIEIISY